MNDYNREADRVAPDLLLCPFCGDNAEEHIYSGAPTIFCRSCPAMMGGEESTATEEELRLAWNRRAPAVGEDALPPLPPRDGDWAGDVWWTADSLREFALQAQRDAVAADRRARQGQTPPAESTPEMDRAGRDVLRACGDDQATDRDAALYWDTMIAIATGDAS